MEEKFSRFCTAAVSDHRQQFVRLDLLAQELTGKHAD
jgi:hypothetical protein